MEILLIRSYVRLTGRGIRAFKAKIRVAGKIVLDKRLFAGELTEFMSYSISHIADGCIIFTGGVRSSIFCFHPRVRLTVEPLDGEYLHIFELITTRGKKLLSKKLTTKLPFDFFDLRPVMIGRMQKYDLGNLGETLSKGFTIESYEYNISLLTVNGQSAYLSSFDKDPILSEDAGTFEIVRSSTLYGKYLKSEGDEMDDSSRYANFIKDELFHDIFFSGWADNIGADRPMTQSESLALAAQYKASCTMFIKYYPLVVAPLESRLDRLDGIDELPTARQDFEKLLKVLKQLYELLQKEPITVQEIRELFVSEGRFQMPSYKLARLVLYMIDEDDENGLDKLLTPLIDECKEITSKLLESTKKSPLYSVCQEAPLHLSITNIKENSLYYSMHNEAGLDLILS